MKLKRLWLPPPGYSLNFSGQAKPTSGQTNRFFTQTNHFFGQTKPTSGQATRCFTQTNRFSGQAKPTSGQTNRCFTQTNRFFGPAKPTSGQTNRFFTQTNRFFGQVNRFTNADFYINLHSFGSGRPSGCVRHTARNSISAKNSHQ